jgi:hypothetical protein
MPQNPSLFPANYPDLCPRTQIQDVDPIAELRAIVIALRHQSLLSARRAGQSIAELQNQTLSILDCCVPAPTVAIAAPTTNDPIATPAPVEIPVVSRRAYFGGGEMQGIHGQIDKFVFDTRVVTALGYQFNTGRQRHAALFSQLRGYWFGGQSASGSGLSSIEAITFESEVKYTISTALTKVRVYPRGAQNESKGYIVGADNDKTFDIFTFATEAIAAGGALPNIANGNVGGWSSTKAYFCGSNVDSFAIDTINFANDATATLAATLSTYRRHGAGLSSASKFYIGGGLRIAGLVANNTFEAVSFATDTVATISAQLSAAVDDVEGIAGGSTGLIAGGYPAQQSRRLQRFDLRYETCEEIAAVLSRGGRYPVPVGKM